MADIKSEQSDPSGMTARTIVNQLRDMGRDALKDQLDAFGKLLKKSIKDSQVDGFVMGFNFCIDQLKAMNVIHVDEGQ